MIFEGLSGAKCIANVPNVPNVQCTSNQNNTDYKRTLNVSHNSIKHTVVYKNNIVLRLLSTSFFILILLMGLITNGTVLDVSAEEDISLWGGSFSRNMVSDEENVPDTWDLASGENIKWTAELGSQSYAGPLIHGGKIFVGTNNEALKNPKLTGDRGNIMAFRESDGEFLWQITHTKLTSGRVNDWPPPGNLLYTIY